MNRENLPVIATDIDGVVIKWQSGLPYFAQKYNLPLEHILNVIIEDKFVPASEIFDCHKDLADKLIKKYNSSDFIRYLAPFDDALEVINRLKDKYRFVAVTALGTDVDSMLNRKFNLQALFPGAFEDIFVCGHDESKSNLFRKVKEKYGTDVVAYIDDMPHHVEAAYEELDCPVFWMPRGPRDSVPECQNRKVKNWNDLEWSLQLSLPIVEKKTQEKDAKNILEIIEELNKARPVQDFTIPLNNNDLFRPITPFSPSDIPTPMTPGDFPKPGTGIPFGDWRNWPRATNSVPNYVLLNNTVSNDDSSTF